MFNIGPGEWLVIFVVVLFLFGAKKLPEIGSALGKAIKELRNSMKDSDDTADKEKK